jgi:hypothetical protein
MGDPLSVVASITAVLQLAGATMKLLSDITNASTMCKKILDEVSCSTGLLYSIKIMFERDGVGKEWSIIAESLIVPNGPLTQFECALMQIRRRIEPIAGIKSARRAMLWPFRKEEVTNLLATVERQKALLALILQGNHTYFCRSWIIYKCLL